MTSPPYWGLRDYGVEGQIGLERTPDEYVAKMVEVFREVRRVLRDDGTLFLNIGDSYAASPGQRKTTDAAGSKQLTNKGAQGAPSRNVEGLNPKDLVGIPWMLAFALCSSGWHLRQDIIWAKPNPMPESVMDRCTKSHEYIFLLSKSPKYYFDAEAIKEDCVAGDRGSKYGTGKTAVHQLGRASGNKRHKRVAAYEASADEELKTSAGLLNISDIAYSKRNKRDVWAVATSPFPEAHFATFPPKLIEPCILAGSPREGLVLDPFAGAGTTGVVALRHRRRFVGIELNPQYIQMAEKRLLAEIMA